MFNSDAMSVSNDGPTGFNPNFTFGNSTHKDTSTQPINISGASRHGSVSQNPRMRRESIAHSQGMGGVSWGSVTIGSWLKDEVMLFAQQHAQERKGSLSFGGNVNAGSIQVQNHKNSINNPASFVPIMEAGGATEGGDAAEGSGAGMSSPNSSSYLADLEANYCKDYSCCGQLLPTLHDLLRHYEEMHIQQEPVVETPRAHPMNGNGMDAVSTNEVFLNPQDEVGGFGQEQGEGKLERGANVGQGRNQGGQMQNNQMQNNQMQNNQLQNNQMQNNQMQNNQLQNNQMQNDQLQIDQNQQTASNNYGEDAEMQIDEFSFDQVPALTTGQSPVGLEEQFQFQDTPGAAGSLFGSGFPLVDDGHQVGSPLGGASFFGGGLATGASAGASTGTSIGGAPGGSGSSTGNQAGGHTGNQVPPGKALLHKHPGTSKRDIATGNDRFRHPAPQQHSQQKNYRLGGFTNTPDEEMEDVCIDDPARRLYVAERDEDRPFKCPVIGCDKNYKNQNGLKYHRLHGHQNQKLRANPDGTFSVIDPRSNAPYPAGADLDKDKPYRCEVCGKRYKNLNGLKYHRGHTTH
ncbi:DEBR0S6_08284g1_1 [Brettanomyces bruxellensis]|uniref:DEBR0S6_08284g1_1 n=1 Tax=Dekkera bruxellensis TaxID=5007 RepID=A0A7D9D057_DEKBR|nr:DEBR0S6_08284g1_1 [Brettanomyces bruxellensis]